MLKLSKDVLRIMQEVQAYSGAGVDYDKPSYRAIGIGEGHAAHGWGFYYAVDYDVADSYRQEALSGELMRFINKDYIVVDVRGFNDRYIDHGNCGLDLALQYCYKTIKSDDELNLDELLKQLNNKIEHLTFKLSLDSSSILQRSKDELVKIEDELSNFVPDKKLKELQELLKIWQSPETAAILDNETIQNSIKQLEKDIEQEKTNIENEYELNRLKEIKVKLQDTIGTIQSNSIYKDIRSIYQIIKFLEENRSKFNSNNIFIISSNEGVVKEVEIPDSPYLEEALSIQQQPDTVKRALYRICIKLGLDEAEMVDVLGNNGKDAYFNLCEVVRDKYGYHYKLTGNGKRADKIVSRLLNREGIKGIHYFGEEDGECYVVFNQLDIKHI